jgi:2-methylisocitrate lyase-like PEP mutase family enzyme
MSVSQTEKAHRFQSLHQGPRVLLLPNPWDAGTARILAALGFDALATTSAGLAFSLGRRDGEGALGRNLVLDNARCIAATTDLPVTADLENGFGDAPEVVAETIRLTAATGVVGGSIEDATGDPTRPLYDFDHAVERVEAAAEAARSLPYPFTLTARAENFHFGRPDLDDTIRRLQAFERVGADVLYAPGLPSLESICTVCAELGKPVNVVMGLNGPRLTVAALAEAGVRRISLGSALSRAAFGALVRAAREIQQDGTFDFVANSPSFRDINRLMESKTQPKP